MTERTRNEIISAGRKAHFEFSDVESDFTFEDITFEVAPVFWASTSSFGNCCGARYLGEFGDHGTIPDFLATTIGAALRRELLTNSRDDRYGVVYATTTNSQAAANQILTAAKFTPIRKFHNPNTQGTPVTVWEWVAPKRWNHGYRRY